MNRYLETIPWPQFGVAVVLGLLLGGVLGFAAGRHYPHPAPCGEPKGNMTMIRKWNSLSLGSAWLEQRPRLAAAYFRIAPVLVMFALVTSGWASVSTWQNGRDTASLAVANQANQVTNCENANESRAATLSLWNFLLNSVLANPSTKPQQVANVAAVKEWIAKLYGPHDCTDLSRKYPIPPPPVIHPVA